MDAGSILKFMEERAARPLKPKEIARALDVEVADYGRFRRTLREMEEAGLIYRVRRGRYALPKRINLVVGRLQITRAGHGFVIPDDGSQDVFIPYPQTGNAFDGDQLIARIERRPRGRNPQGTVVRVLERARTQVVGVYQRSGRFGFVVPDGRAFHKDVFVLPGNEAGARPGEVVVARITDWGSEHHNPAGEILKVLGVSGEAGVDVLAIIHAQELRTEFPAAAIEEADRIKAEPPPVDDTGPERLDLRGLLTFTIDPVDAKDHDDALSIEPMEKGGWRVGVHIADVAHYVREGSPIDEEAYRRATSVYLVDRVLPMLPDVLSGDLCSLKPDEDRLAMSVLLELGADATVRSVELASSQIRSRRRLSYEGAQEILEGKESSDRKLRDALRQLRDLARRLRERRQKRGGLDFDLPEARVIVNSAGEPMVIERLLRLETHRLIEEFMILANECVARMARRGNWPFVYRIHDPPEADRIEQLRDFISGLGFNLPKRELRSPKALQSVLSAVEGTREGPLVSMLVLRSMQQARYSVDRKGHFGLAARAYTHFTSPIRRYPDLAIHRIVRAQLFEGRTLPAEMTERLAGLASHASFCERRAEEAERQSVELKKIEYMERHLGDSFSGTISGVTSFGFFVLMDDVLVEGLVHVSQLEDDYYRLVEEEHALVGEQRRRRFRIGDEVQVRVTSVRRETTEIDLALDE